MKDSRVVFGAIVLASVVALAMPLTTDAAHAFGRGAGGGGGHFGGGGFRPGGGGVTVR